MNKEERRIELRREEYVNRWKAIWQGISENKQHLMEMGFIDSADEDMVKILELKKWYLGKRLYKIAKKLRYDVDGVNELWWVNYWCLSEDCLCHGDVLADMKEDTKIIVRAVTYR